MRKDANLAKFESEFYLKKGIIFMLEMLKIFEYILAPNSSCTELTHRNWR